MNPEIGSPPVSETPTAPYVCHDRDCGPVCDFCQWYRFNGDWRGVYMGKGECVHPAHPHAEEPHGGCDDYVCAHWPNADPQLAVLHFAANRAEQPPAAERTP